MSLAVKTGLLFSVFTAVAVPLLALRHFYAALIEREEQHALWLVMACLSGAWFLNVVAFFPFIPSVYKHGFWLPRLVAPALCVFLGLAFAGLDKLLPPHRPAWQWLCLLAACLQSCLHFSFLWA